MNYEIMLIKSIIQLDLLVAISNERFPLHFIDLIIMLALFLE